MIRTLGLMRTISRIADMDLKAYPQSGSRIDFSNRKADVVFEIHRDGIHSPSLDIGMTSEDGTHRILVPRALHADLPGDGGAMSAYLRMVQGAASIRSDPTSPTLRRRYGHAMRIAALVPRGIAKGGGRAALDLVAATSVSGARVTAQNGYHVLPEALRLVSDFIPHGRTTRILFHAVRGMTRTWEVGGLQTPIGVVEPIDAVQRLRMASDMTREFADDPDRLELIRLACIGAEQSSRMAA